MRFIASGRSGLTGKDGEGLADGEADVGPPEGVASGVVSVQPDKTSPTATASPTTRIAALPIRAPSPLKSPPLRIRNGRE
ncbi:hypothetical protein GCM10027063_35010 [Promicromonospora xylanilytica]